MADSFYLTTGDVVEGEIIQATRNTVVIRSGGSVRPAGISLIERVVLKLADGSELNGDFVGWEDGVYELRSADLLMKVRDGQILDDGTELQVAAEQAEESQQPSASRGLTQSSSSQVITMQGLPEFTLKKGQTLIGQIIHVTGSIATIRTHDGGIVSTSRAQIENVRFVADNGDLHSGRLIDWSNNVYQLKDGDQDVVASLSEAAIKAGPSSAYHSQSAAIASLDKPAIAAIESADAAVAPDVQVASSENAAGEQLEPNAARSVGAANEDGVSNAVDTAGVGGPASETAIAKLAEPEAPASQSTEDNTDSAQSPYLVEPSVADVGEDSEEVVFEFRLKQPTDRPLVFLYAATDDTAKAGQDFQAKSGVVTFGAGTEYAEVRVPLIDDEQSENSEQFHLFLSGDPETIQFSQRQVVATINDND
ncbi:MAG: Calx-beta domain-containing protein [Geminicoccaceae bacterium]